MAEGFNTVTSHSVTQLAEDIKSAISGITFNTKVVIDSVDEGDENQPATVTWHTENFLVRAWRNLWSLGKYGAVRDQNVALAFKSLVDKGANNGDDVQQKKAAFDLAKIFSIETSRGNVARKFTDAILLKSLKPLTAPESVSAPAANTTTAPEIKLSSALKNIHGAADILREIPGEYDAVNTLIEDHADTVAKLEAYSEGDTNIDINDLHERLLNFQNGLEAILTRSGGIIVNLRTGVLDALNAVRQTLDQPPYESSKVNAHKERVARYQREAAERDSLAQRTRETATQVPDILITRPSVTPQFSSSAPFVVSRAPVQSEKTYNTPVEKLARAIELIGLASETVKRTTGDTLEFKRVFDSHIPNEANIKSAQLALSDAQNFQYPTPDAVQQITQRINDPNFRAFLKKYPTVAPSVERYYQLSEDIDKGLRSTPPASRESLKALREQATNLQIQVATTVAQEIGIGNEQIFDEIFAALTPLVDVISEHVPVKGQNQSISVTNNSSGDASDKLQRLEEALQRTHDGLERVQTRVGGSFNFTRGYLFDALNHVRAINGKGPADADASRLY